MAGANDRLELDQQIQMIRFQFLSLVDHLDFAERQSVQPIDGRHLPVAMFLGQFGQPLHLVLGRILALAGRPRVSVTVRLLVHPDTQIEHPLAIHSVLAEERNRRPADDRRFARSGAVQNG